MDVWRIGVAITLNNGVSGVLSIIAKDMLGLKAPIGEIEKGFQNWGGAIKGAAFILAGSGLITGLDFMAKKASNLNDALVKLKMASLNAKVPIDIGAERTIAFDVGERYGLDATQVVDDLRESRYAFGTMAKANQFIDPLEKMRTVINALNPGGGDKAADSVYAMARSAELKGKVGADDFMPLFQGMMKAMVASGGKMTPADYVQATKYGRVATAGWSDAFYTTVLPSLVQELGASGAGTALMTFQQASVRQTKGASHLWEKLGLLNPAAVTSNGTGVTIGPGGFKDDALYSSNPYLWAQKYLLPAIDKQIGHVATVGDTDALRIIETLYGPRMAAQMANILVNQSQRINKDIGLTSDAGNIDQSGDLTQKEDAARADAALAAAQTNFMNALGGPLVQVRIDTLNNLTAAINWLTSSLLKFDEAHPGTLKLIGEGLLGLGAALIVIGTVAVLAACAALLPGGAIALTVIAIGGIIGMIAGFNWQGMQSTLAGIWGDISKTAAGNAPEAQGGWARLMHPVIPLRDPMRSQNPALMHHSSFVPPPSGQGVAQMQPVNLVVDGRKLGAVVAAYQARAAGGPNIGSSYFDPTSSYSPV
ncbi:MAG: hypothetical protein P4M09_16900 [Devosia sp.]|nr:hypothetical protein [Devosia sp.]